MKKDIAFIVCILLLGTAVSGFGQTKEADIVKLLEVTNTRSIALHTIELFMPQMQQLFPTIPEEFWALLWSKLDIDEFIKNFIPIYDRNFTHKEIKELIKFYESPIGKRLVEATPAITQESMKVGQEWGERMGQLILNEIMSSGYL
jgi:hypothetical protein